MNASCEGEKEEEGTQGDEELPVYHYILEVFDKSVQAAIVMQRAFRLLKAKCKSGVMPSDEDPFHYKHFTKIRDLVGWSKDELYDEYGDKRERTDGGKPNRKKKTEGSYRLMDEIRNAHLSKIDVDANEAHMKQLEAARGHWSKRFASNDALNRLLNARSNVSMVSGYLRERWNKMKEEEARSALLKNPLKDEFKQGSQQWEKLMHWMLSNGHGAPIRMHEPVLLDLQASLSVNSESHRLRIMGLLAQFNTILRIKQGQLPMAAASGTDGAQTTVPDANEVQQNVKVNTLAVGLFDWAIKDTGLEYKEELEESRRYAATPPEPPEGLERDLYRFHAQVCAALKSSSYRTCRLRKSGREFLQAFEDSTQKRRRLIRTRSSGNLGLLGPPSVDPSSVTVIHPLAGKPKGDTARQWVHTQLQDIVRKQVKRQKCGRGGRPLHCINTEWMGGVDWRMIESRATGCPPPKGLRIPPKPTDQELGDLFEVFAKSKNAMNQATMEAKRGDKDCESVASMRSSHSSETSPDDPDIPFDSSSLYVQEVHDILEESGLTGLGCKTVLAKLMAAARAPIYMLPLDSAKAAAAAKSWLQTSQGAKEDHYFATQHARLLHCEHASMGSTTHNQAILEVAKDHGVAVQSRSLCDLLPNQLGRAIERALEQTLSEGASTMNSPEITWPMMLQCWRTAGLPGWQGQDGRALWKAMNAFSASHTWDSSSLDPPSTNTHSWNTNGPPSFSCTTPSANQLRGLSSLASPGPSHSPATPLPAAPFSPSAGATPFATLSANRGLSKSDSLKPPSARRAGLVMSASTPSLANLKQRCADGGAEVGTPFEPYSPSISTRLSGSLASPFAASSTSQLSLSFTNGGANSPSAMAQARAIARERRRQQALEAHAANRAKRESWAYDVSPKASAPNSQALKSLAPTSTLKQPLASSGSLKQSSSASALTRPKTSLRSEASYRPRAHVPSRATSVSGGVSSSNDEDEDDEKGVEGPGESGIVGPPTSDMLLLHRNEFWSSVLADAHVIVLFAEHHMPWRPYFHGASHKQRQLRVRKHAETVQKLALYVEHHFNLQKLSKAIRVGPAKVTQAGAEARRQMQLNWCKLVKSEVYKWLNRYLVLGKLPSNFMQVQEESSFFADAEHKEQKQELEQDLELEPSPFERRLHAIEEAPTEATSTPVTSVDNCLVTIGGSVAVEGATAAVVADPEPASLDQDAPLAGTQPCRPLLPHPPSRPSSSTSSSHHREADRAMRTPSSDSQPTRSSPAQSPYIHSRASAPAAPSPVSIKSLAPLPAKSSGIETSISRPPSAATHNPSRMQTISNQPAAAAQNPSEVQLLTGQLQPPAPGLLREASFSSPPVSPKTALQGLQADQRLSPSFSDRGYRGMRRSLAGSLPSRQVIASPLALSGSQRSLPKHDIVFDRPERSSFSGSMSSRDFLLQRQGPAINSVLSSRDSFSLRQAPATNSLTRNKGRFANADAMLERSQGFSFQGLPSPHQQPWQDSRSSAPDQSCLRAGLPTSGLALYSNSSSRGSNSHSSPLVKFGAAKYGTSRSTNSSGPLLKFGAAEPRGGVASRQSADVGETSNRSSSSGIPFLVGNDGGSDGMDLNGLLEIQGEGSPGF